MDNGNKDRARSLIFFVMDSLLGCLKRGGFENNADLEENFGRNEAFEYQS
jgi:hypothetical protein